MKRKIAPLFLVNAAFLGLVGFNIRASEPVKLVAETNHSTIQFSVPISNGLTRITGKFNEFSIDVELGDNDITKSRIVAVIKVNSINTGIPSRDEDLKTADFFDVEKFPEITFTSDKIVKEGNGYVAKGQFQMHGITKPMELRFKITGQSDNGVIGFTSRSSLKRSDFNVGTEFKHTTEDNFISDEIGVEIDFWTKKPKEKN
jgi:polyisoprenoid-binding protein YceI